MTNITLEQVFGVSKNQVLSYYERLDVDGALQDALKSDKQIIVYGSSKQGKTALVDKHIPYAENLVVSLTPKFELIDIYKDVLREAGYQITVSTTTGRTRGAEFTTEAKAQAGIYFIGKIDAGVVGKLDSNLSHEQTTQPLEINLELPNDIARALKSIKFNKFIILENFHYLDEEKQKQLSFDLRSFQELGIRFVVLGVWREKNRLAQFNGDLLDRIVEVPVEPWLHKDFMEVIKKGSKFLNVTFTPEVTTPLIEAAFDSIGVVQELLITVCKYKSIFVPQAGLLVIDDPQLVEKAITEKANVYSARHIRALETIAEGRKATHRTKKGETPLYLPFYLVKAFLTTDFELIQNGVRREQLETAIKAMHHRPTGIKAADFSGLLYNFASLQSEKGIRPPIFDYDRASRTMRVVDSTFYFFLKNANRAEALEALNDPLDSHSPATNLGREK